MGGGRACPQEEYGDMNSIDLKRAFFDTVKQHEFASPLREAALAEDMAAWTRHLTSAVIKSCQIIGWQAAAKGQRLHFLPEARNEYLTIDVMAFPQTSVSWPLPVAAFELENNRDRIAYSFWKLLCLRISFRVLFCYRKEALERDSLIRMLQEDVLRSMNTPPEGDTLLVIGSRDESSVFPYGFFRWWHLNPNTVSFNVI